MTEPTAAPDLSDSNSDSDDGPPSGLWQKMKADPEYAPEHLALEAVTRLGPRMARELDKLKGQNPGAPADALANMIVYRYVNQSRLSGAVSGAVPLAGAVLDIGVLAWTQARMVLMLAANYGMDPAHPDRAAELLVLQNVHKYAQTARTALAVAKGRERLDALLPEDRPTVGRVMVKLGLKLAQMAGVRAAKKMLAKVVPGAGIILGGVANGNATKALGGRAITLYRRPPFRPALPPGVPYQAGPPPQHYTVHPPHALPPAPYHPGVPPQPGPPVPSAPPAYSAPPPVGPPVPTAPSAQAAPFAPVARPVGPPVPVRPSAQPAPSAPLAPSGPLPPTGPLAPTGPFAPSAPAAPAAPFAPTVQAPPAAQVAPPVQGWLLDPPAPAGQPEAATQPATAVAAGAVAQPGAAVAGGAVAPTAELPGEPEAPVWPTKPLPAAPVAPTKVLPADPPTGETPAG
ncbi:EcsC family protein [Dactylosporangium sp. AC04546]|uniref:EcsC family protein n=1 Tax=Dactylosporangium sp. AC04546 TaxID=2862460 RepID=UPI0027DF16D0|nr:EcsC family protein [Dactylosporangium sp. AC04546]WVK89160.1 EcsC family protein [Dactylosporangium sp. AC04546]